jgi:hypothetical protein
MLPKKVNLTKFRGYESKKRKSKKFKWEKKVNRESTGKIDKGQDRGQDQTDKCQLSMRNCSNKEKTSDNSKFLSRAKGIGLMKRFKGKHKSVTSFLKNCKMKNWNFKVKMKSV